MASPGLCHYAHKNIHYHLLCAAVRVFRPLSRVHPSGGLVPRLLFLVERRYPLLYWCRGIKHFITPRALAQAQQKAERQQEQVGPQAGL